MTSLHDTSELGPVSIEPATTADRAAISLLVPHYRHLVETGWGLVALAGEGASRSVVGVVLLSNRYVDPTRAAIGIRLNVMKFLMDSRVPEQLLEQALVSVEEWGARSLRVLEHVDEDGEEALLFKRLGFRESDTFDSFELDLKETIEGWRYAEDVIGRNFKESGAVEIQGLDERHIRKVAACWAGWIGGNPEEHLDMLVRSIAGIELRIDPVYSRVVTLDGNLVGIALCCVEQDALKVHALAVDPKTRMTGIQTKMLLDLAVPAFEAGARTQFFEAGRSQPDTQRVAKRLDARLVKSRICFERDL